MPNDFRHSKKFSDKRNHEPSLGNVREETTESLSKVVCIPLLAGVSFVFSYVQPTSKNFLSCNGSYQCNKTIHMQKKLVLHFHCAVHLDIECKKLDTQGSYQYKKLARNIPGLFRTWVSYTFFLSCKGVLPVQ